jgi:pSer/pThr/pTyr-binding forkhead associated (FHA) protein
MAVLALLVDDVVVKEFPLNKPRLTIGRRSGNDVRIDDASVSGAHAAIEVRNNEFLEGAKDYFLEDLGSTNGTKVNGVSVKRRRLNPSDVIGIGWNTFKFMDDSAPQLTETVYILPGS